MNLDYVTLHYRSVLNDFSNQFSNEEFSDCVLNAEGKSLKVHKAMLCAQSSFLEVSMQHMLIVKFSSLTYLLLIRAIAFVPENRT